MKLPSLKKEDPGPDMAVSSALPLTLHPYRASTLLYIPLERFPQGVIALLIQEQIAALPIDYRREGPCIVA